MYTNLLVLTVLSLPVLGADFSQFVSHDFRAMLRRGDALAKRQGYYPSSTPCGSGTTCAEACGTGQVECPANIGRGVCFDPSLAHCCPDGSGYSCDSGYFCSSDGQKNTYCCPNGMDLGACAEAYSLTVSLISQTGTFLVPSEAETASAFTSASEPTSTTPIYITSIPSSSSTPNYITSLSTPTVTTSFGNGSYTTSAPPIVFPGAAVKDTGAGIAFLSGFLVLMGVL